MESLWQHSDLHFNCPDIFIYVLLHMQEDVWFKFALAKLSEIQRATLVKCEKIKLAS